MRPYVTDIAHDAQHVTRVARFETAGAFADFLKGATPHSAGRSPWTGGEDLDDARKLCREGRPAAIAAAQALLDQIDAQGIQTYRPRWQPDVYGAMPDVPRYVAGAPDCMLRPDRRESESAPVKLYVDVCVSAACTADLLSRRGNAVLALALKLSQFRPVELCVYADMGARFPDGDAAKRHAIIPVVSIPSNPMDLAAASYAMTSAGFLRQMCFSYGEQHGFTGHWAWNTTPSLSAREGPYEARVKEALGVTDDDVIVYGGHIMHALINDPVAWVTEQLQRYVGQE